MDRREAIKRTAWLMGGIVSIHLGRSTYAKVMVHDVAAKFAAVISKAVRESIRDRVQHDER